MRKIGNKKKERDYSSEQFMKIEATVTKREKVIVDVDFPFYRKSDDSDDNAEWKTVRKVESGKITTLYKRENYHGEIEYQIEFEKHDIRSRDYDFVVGTKLNIATVGEFNDMLHEIREKVESLLKNDA